MSAVMMILINVPTTAYRERGRASRKSRADGGSCPARDDKQSQHRDRKWEDSPWRTVSRAPGDETPEKADHGGISGKSFIDPEVLRRQRAEETRVYGENACQALFQSRPEAIVRAWFIRA